MTLGSLAEGGQVNLGGNNESAVFLGMIMDLIRGAREFPQENATTSSFSSLGSLPLRNPPAGDAKVYFCGAEKMSSI
ncbi:MAG: hypothetical protein IT578_11180 [Verrucomicrobiae bacterium]|nr:hypothetical protein [Verrucomicrobiae bacterium]